MVRDFAPMHLAKSPLVFVLAQVVISSVLKMESSIPEIQERLRRKGYVRFVREESQQITLGPMPSVQMFTRWIFTNRENTEAIVLSSSFIILETTRYRSFDTFVSLLEEALVVVGDLVGPASDLLVERLGLRYVDRVAPAPGESFADYLDPGLLGISAEKLKVHDLVETYQAMGATPAGQFSLRLTQTSDAVFLPPDLPASQLTFADFRQEGRSIALLDIDNYAVKQFDFSPAQLVKHLWQLHRCADRAFRSCVTERAMRSWQAQPTSAGLS